MNNLQKYNFVPTTVRGDQFLAYGQPAVYMTDQRPSGDIYASLLAKVSQSSGENMNSNQLREYLQNNALDIASDFFNTTSTKFYNMEVPGAFNSCSGEISESNIYSGEEQLINSEGMPQMFRRQCTIHGDACTTKWENTPFPQQGQHCRYN